MSYKLIGGVKSRVSLDIKIRALHEILVKHRSAESVLGEIYKGFGKKAPTSLSVTVTNWKKAVQTALDNNDQVVLGLCKELGLLVGSVKENPEKIKEKPEKIKEKKKVAVPESEEDSDELPSFDEEEEVEEKKEEDEEALPSFEEEEDETPVAPRRGRGRPKKVGV
jgi:phosphopantothenoylcysteine synthetase/decarboxylase